MYGNKQNDQNKLWEETVQSLSIYTGLQLNDYALREIAQSFVSKFQMALLATPRLTWQSLLEILPIHETYFYRDIPQIHHIRQHVIPSLLDHASQKKPSRLRLWSAGCSTGEETYLFTFLVLEELLRRGEAYWSPSGEIVINPVWDIVIVGTDLADKVLGHARNGCYRYQHGQGAFRDFPPNFYMFFSPPIRNPSHNQLATHEIHVKPSVRALTRFVQHNLATGFPLSEEPYDLVVCRNVLIYINNSVKSRIQKMFYRCLRHGGYLVLGPPDPMLLPDFFHRLFRPLSVCYEKKASDCLE